MKVLVIGSGGREHAICVSLKKSPKVNKIFCIPGNAGTAQIAENVNIEINNFEKIKDYTKFLIKKLKLNVKIKFKKSKPDGVFRKVLDVSKAKKYGWKAKISLDRGFELTYKDFLKKNIT